MADVIQIKRGVKADLPSYLKIGELAFCTDTQELFCGMGEGTPIKQVRDTSLDRQLKSILNKTKQLGKCVNDKDCSIVNIGGDTKIVNHRVEVTTPLSEMVIKVKPPDTLRLVFPMSITSDKQCNLTLIGYDDNTINYKYNGEKDKIILYITYLAENRKF